MVTVKRPTGGTLKCGLYLNAAAFSAARERLRDAPKRIHQHRITIGIHEDKGAEEKHNYRGEGSGTSVAEVAAVHEFGAGPVPSRSFIRDWFDERREDFAAELTSAMRKQYQSEESGQKIAPSIADFATDALDSMKARIESGDELEPLSEATERARERAGLSIGPPLLATSQLLNALEAKVDGFFVGGGK